MKNNKNNIKSSDYYLGLDVGTNSVGWAVTDEDYNVLKFKGNSMWGVRLFEEAQDASARRTARSARRRLARRKQRLLLLEMLFAEEICKTDPNFFVRLHESMLHNSDKQLSDRYLLFNDEDYKDKDFYRDYKTMYHLRSELIHSTEPHDARLVFLAIHHIIKNRGHFLFETEVNSDERTTYDCLSDLNLFLKSEYGQTMTFTDQQKYADCLKREDLNITQKKKELRSIMIKNAAQEDELINPLFLSDLLAGATVKFSDLFCDDSLKDSEPKSFCLKKDVDEVFDSLSSVLGENVELLIQAKTVFDSARLSQVLKGEKFISDAKINLFEKNKKDLRKLKDYVKEYEPKKYKEIFSIKEDKLNNYAAYSNNKYESGDYKCNQEEFCTYLKKTLPDMKNNDLYNDIYQEIEDKSFLTKLIGADNGVIPCQLHLKELEVILKNAAVYLEFLNVKDDDEISVSDKIISIFKFKIPYYVGPLNKKSPNNWIERTDEKIYPWNFNKVVDTKKSAENFIVNLIGRCSYTGDYVIPKDSLLYSEYMLRNEINMLRVNGKELPRDVMEELYEDLFVQQYKKVTAKGIKNYLISKGLITGTDEISGIDIFVKSKLKSYHDFKRLLSGGMSKNDVEDIIRRIVVFGEDKKLLREWLEEKYKTLPKEDISYICRLKYKDWGRLSREFLTEIYHIDENGNSLCIMDMLKLYNVNLSHLMSNKYQFGEEAEKARKINLGTDDSLDKQIEDMYIAPAVKRSVRQTLKIIDEITDIKKTAPKKIFVEVARGTIENQKGKRTKSRKDRLIELYKACGEESNYLFEKLSNEDENKLRGDKLYLYYAQFGRCMYSGESIDFDMMIKDNMTYDIDHIFPRSRIKDDSIDNRVLVKSVLNREKTNTYPISAEIREKQYPFWKALKEKGLISEKKFSRLVRQTPLTAKELSEFVAVQLVETQQSTKAIISLIKDYYPNTKVIFSKAMNVSDFRHKFEFVKCRDLNNYHHAKDAYLNVVVGNVYTTKFTDNFFKNISFENYSLNRVFEYDVPKAWKADGSSIKTVRKYMDKNNIRVTRMPREAKGQLYDLTIMPAGKGQMPIKTGMSIEKYGGYNKVSGAYYFVVEHTKNKERIRTIENVMICDKPDYEKDGIKYCIEKLNLLDPVIIVPMIRVDTLMEFNGSKVYISGRTGDYYVCKHAYELSADSDHEQYLKNIEKYLNRCFSAKKELDITEFDGITREENIDLYDWYIQKLSNNVYIRFFKNVVGHLNTNKDTFESLSIYDQCKALTEILKFFKCDRQLSDLSMINGKKKMGVIKFNKNISKLDSAYVINQSPTGLYEEKINLLK